MFCAGFLPYIVETIALQWSSSPSYGTFTRVSITVKLVAIIAGTPETSFWVLAVVMTTSIIGEALINI